MLMEEILGPGTREKTLQVLFSPRPHYGVLCKDPYEVGYILSCVLCTVYCVENTWTKRLAREGGVKVRVRVRVGQKLEGRR